MLECCVPVANYAVQYFLMGEMFTYIAGMKKVVTEQCIQYNLKYIKSVYM